MSNDTIEACNRAGELMSEQVAALRVGKTDNLNHTHAEISIVNQVINELSAKIANKSSSETGARGWNSRVDYAALNSGRRSSSVPKPQISISELEKQLRENA